MAGLPYMQFYVGDWRRATDVQSLPYHERGIWFEMLCLMHDSPLCGELSNADGTPMAEEEVARLLGLARQDYTKARDLILRKGVASVNEHGVIYSRRMVKDRQAKEAKSRAGKAGADSRWLGKAIAEAWQLSVSDLCLWIGSSEEDQKKIREGLEQWQAYRQQRAKAPIDWVLYWRKQLKFLGQYSIPVALGFIDESIRQNWQGLFAPPHFQNGTPSTRINGANTVLLQKEYDRILARMQIVKGNYASHQSWDKKDTEEWGKLKTRRDELRKILGVTI